MKREYNKEIKGKSFARVYGELLDKLMINPEYESSPRGQQTKEITDITLEIEDPTQCVYHNERRSSQFEYISAELIWYFSGDRSVKFIDQYAKFWRNIAHVSNDYIVDQESYDAYKNWKAIEGETFDEGTERLNKLRENFVVNNYIVNSAYGDLIFKRKNEHGFSQYHWAFESLANDKDTRQAIMHFNLPEHQHEDNRDFVCTLTGAFMIRDDKLNLTISMRSNDAILGTPTDVAFFCTLQRHMLYHLKPLYPDLKLGVYRHKVHSMHVYEKHFGLIYEMLKHNFKTDTLPSIDKPFINIDGSPTDITKNLFEWASDDVREPIIGMTQDSFVNFLTNNLLTDEQEKEN